MGSTLPLGHAWLLHWGGCCSAGAWHATVSRGCTVQHQLHNQQWGGPGLGWVCLNWSFLWD